ncbi:sensor histidine kinase [Belnapia rosea]|uniref:sensor histidine kinase n=1 Tax=Belnapia rosea TaxID=938405 RepID=UPI00088E81FA|nr:sensor histidine kinase [Belnapia rosea]SDB64209.1 PAS domain S-box-containing protein [Belnapia rosea]
MAPDAGRPRAKLAWLPDPAWCLPLLLAIALFTVAVLPLWSADGMVYGTAWYCAVLMLASLGLVGIAIMLARRMTRLGEQIAASSAALAISKAQLQRAQRIGRVGGFEIDFRSGENHRSGAYMSVQGLPGEARIEQHADWVHRLHPEDRERAERYFLDAVADGSGITDYAQEYRIIAPSGDVRWISARAEIERDTTGRALRMVGAHVDVTDMKQAEAARRASEERLRLAQEAAGLGVWERDLRTGAAVWSAEQYRLTGFDPASGPPSREALQACILPEAPSREAPAAERAAYQEDGSFRRQFRIRHVGDGGIRTILALGRVFRNATGRPIRVIGVNLDITDRVRAEERQLLLTRELDHRAKNALAVVQAALRLTPREDPAAFARAVQGRVAALTRAHTLLAKGGWSGAGLRTLLQGEVEPFLGAPAQMVLDGPPIRLAAVAAQPIAMAVHELATNAMKYGALSTDTGRVVVRWREEADSLVLDWTEEGGPPVMAAPQRRGFGTRVIEATLGAQLGGMVRFDWQAGGLVCAIRLPLGRVVALTGPIEEPPELSLEGLGG